MCDRKQKDDEKRDDEDEEGGEEEPGLENIAAQLIQSHLIEHSEKNITILAACCLYDIFRVYAPDAPYSQEQMEVTIKQSFKRIIKYTKTFHKHSPSNKKNKI